VKRIIAFVLILSLLVGASPAFAARTKKGASQKAYASASDEAVFYRVGDWFATVGKSEDEKSAIIAQRKAKRTAQCAQKELEKKKRQAQKEAKKTQKKLKKSFKQ